MEEKRNFKELGIEFEILSVRSCARGVNANNCFRFAAPAANIALVYGIGGIGMTTAAPDALYMHALMKAERGLLAKGEISGKESRRMVRSNDFGTTPNWVDANCEENGEDLSNGDTGPERRVANSGLVCRDQLQLQYNWGRRAENPLFQCRCKRYFSPPLTFS